MNAIKWWGKIGVISHISILVSIMVSSSYSGSCMGAQLNRPMQRFAIATLGSSISMAHNTPAMLFMDDCGFNSTRQVYFGINVDALQFFKRPLSKFHETDHELLHLTLCLVSYDIVCHCGNFYSDTICFNKCCHPNLLFVHPNANYWNQSLV